MKERLALSIGWWFSDIWYFCKRYVKKFSKKAVNLSTNTSATNKSIVVDCCSLSYTNERSIHSLSWAYANGFPSDAPSGHLRLVWFIKKGYPWVGGPDQSKSMMATLLSPGP